MIGSTMPATSDRMMFPHAGCAGVEAKVVGRHFGLSVPGDDGISPICSTSRNVSPLSVFMYALSREYGSQNINGHTRGIAGWRTLINEIGSGRYYEYRRCSQISVQHPNIAMRRFIACRVCRALVWFPSCCGLAVFSSLTVSAPDPWVLPACTPGVGGCACSVFWFSSCMALVVHRHATLWETTLFHLSTCRGCA